MMAHRHRPRALIDPAKRHRHRWRPMFSIVRSLVTSDQRLAIIREDTGAPRMRILPRPGVALTRQRLHAHRAFTIEEVRTILTRFAIVADDFEPSYISWSDPSIRWVHDEVAARQPLVDVARSDPNSGALGARRGLPL